MAPLRPLEDEVKRVFMGCDSEGVLNEVVALLQKLIRCQAVNCGDGACQEIKCINVLKDFFASHGITSCKTYHRPGKPSRPSLIVEYGAGSPRVMLGPGHVDVVPVSSPDGGETYPGWDSPPFEGRVTKDGVLIGRGAVDMLNTVAAQAVVFAHIVKAVPVQGTLVFCAVPDEEAGGVDGVGYLLSDPALREVFRADYAMTELGGPWLLDKNHQPTNTVVQANSEKGLATAVIRCKGRQGHGSLPLNGDNALVRASEVVSKIGGYWCPTVVTDEWRSFASSLDLPWLLKLCLGNRWTLTWIIRLLLRIKSPFGPIAHALTRMTMSPNHVTGTLKSNVVPGEAVVEVDVRLLPGQDQGYMMQQLRRALGSAIMDDKERYQVSIERFTPSTRSSVHTPLWEAMSKAANTLFPGCRFAYPTLPGATDCRFYRMAGTVAYGANLFEPVTDFAKLMKYFHGTNEQIDVCSLLASTQFYALTVLNMMERR